MHSEIHSACNQHAISMHPRRHRLTIALGEHRLAKEISAARPSRISATEIYLGAVLGARSLRSGGSNREKLRSHAMHVAYEVIAWNDAQRRSERMRSSVAISGYRWPSSGTPRAWQSEAIRGNERHAPGTSGSVAESLTTTSVYAEHTMLFK